MLSPSAPRMFCSCCACSCSMRISAISCWCSLFAARAGTAAMTRPATRITRRMVCLIGSLRGDDEMRPAVLRPGAFVMTGIEREFLAVAHGAEPIGGNTQGHQIRAGGDGPPLAQCQIVLGGPAFVAVSFDGHRPGRIFLEDDGVLLERFLRGWRQIV